MPISRRNFLKTGAASAAGLALGRAGAGPAQAAIAPAGRPITPGPFQPTWASLQHYQIPQWFQDAKFGIWAHWTAQCVPAMGDWYARQMYQQGNPDYRYQCTHYGHPSKVGFKDIDHIWHAENWDPEYLIGLYKAAGAKYFMALGQHHDNFDCYNSAYQPWNSVALGPKKDIVGTWAKIARAHGMRFAVSSHGSHAWQFFEPAQGADSTGLLAGVPYDGKLTKADGVGQWWEGLDPQDLYAQNHTPNPRGLNWDWHVAPGSAPDAAYCNKFYNRIIDLIEKYQPDMVYFDDDILPLYQVDPTVGLSIAANFYNQSAQRNGGKPDVVVTGKNLSDLQRECLVMDYERGRSDAILPQHWQTDTCIGNWHYQLSLYENHQYKKPDQVVKMLMDIVSKNGNLMLNIPVRGDGTIDPDELAFLEDFTPWMQVNEEAIFGSRPWTVSSEGPDKLRGGAGFSEGGESALGPADFRFTTQKDVLYATAMGWPDSGSYTVRSLGANVPGIQGDVKQVSLLGHGPVPFQRTAAGLVVSLPQTQPCDYAYILKIEGLDVPGSHPMLPTAAKPAEVIVVPAASGRITLGAAQAELHGALQTQGTAPVNIGYWNSPADTASWKVDFPAPGQYRLAASIAAAAGATSFTVSVDGGSPVKVVVPETGDWNKFQTVTAGTLTVPAAGDHTVTVTPSDIASWFPINLASLTLTRVA